MWSGKIFMRFILLGVLVLWSSVCAEPALRLSWEQYRRQFLDQPRLKATLADSSLSPEVRRLAIASDFFEEKRFDSALVAYQGA